MIEKYCEKNKCVYLAFIDLEKEYYRVDSIAMGQVLEIYPGDGDLRSVVKIFHEKSNE